MFFNEVFDGDPEVIEAYFDAVDWILSSSGKGSALRDILKLEDLAESTLSRLFESVVIVIEMRIALRFILTSIIFINNAISGSFGYCFTEQ